MIQRIFKMLLFNFKEVNIRTMCDFDDQYNSFRAFGFWYFGTSFNKNETIKHLEQFNHDPENLQEDIVV